MYRTIMCVIKGLNLYLWMLIFGQKLLCARTDDHYIDPTGKIILKVTDCQADGVMYIQSGGTAYNMQFTENGTMVYSCGFVDCNLSWNSPFTFVIQRKLDIQTAHDVKLVFACVLDQSEIIPNLESTNQNLNSENTQFYVYTAMASMNFYSSDGKQIVSGSYIKLGANVTMEIKLVNTHDDLLDINVKSCSAAGIEIINNRCPFDGDLFNLFHKPSMGVVQNIFQMFRTTSSNPEPVSMFFSCLLEVCYAPCITYDCNGTVAIPQASRREKRETQEPGQVAKSMKVGSLFKVGLEDPVLVYEEKIDKCVAVYIYVATIPVIGFLLFLSLSAMIYYWQEWKKMRYSLSRVKEAVENSDKYLKDGLARGGNHKLESLESGLKTEDSLNRAALELVIDDKIERPEPSPVIRECDKRNKPSLAKEDKTTELEVEKSCALNKTSTIEKLLFRWTN